MARLARTMLCALLVWAPWPLGSNRPIFWVINGLLACCILALFLIGEVRQGAAYRVDWRPAAFACAAFVLALLWMLVQTVGGVPAALRHPAWANLPEAIADGIGAISINPGATFATLAQVAPVGALAVVAMRMAFDPRRSAFLLKVIVASATAVAAYGLLAQFGGFRQTFLLARDAYPGFLTGSFVGRNAASMYFVIGIMAATSLIADRFDRLAQEGAFGGSRLAAASELMSAAGIFLIADLILVAALLDTGSRAGVLASGIGLLCVLVISLGRGGAGRRWTALLFLAILAALFGIGIVSSDLLVGRLQEGIGSGDRVNAYRDTLDMIAARPWLGHGAGTFADAFPLFHSRASSLEVWLHAHNTYLQTVAELGIPASLLLLAGIAVVAVTLVRNVRAGSEVQPAATAALAALAAVAFHSIVDFGVQIQAVGLTMAVLLGAGLGETLARKARQARPSADPPKREMRQRETIRVTIPTGPAPVAPAPSG